MKRKRKKLISTMLSVIMGIEIAVSAVPIQTVQAKEIEQVESVLEAEDHARVNMIEGSTALSELQEPKTAASGDGQVTSLPSKYSSIDLGYTSKVRNQAPYGNCWAHSAIACLEIAMIKDNLADTDTLELSIPHGIYYYFRPVVDPLGGTEDDYAGVTRDKTVTSMLQDGGFASYIGNSTLSWQGPVLAEDFMSYTELQGNYNYIESSAAMAKKEYAYGNKAAIVTEMILDQKPSREKMKKAIIEYGSVGINYDSNKSFYDEEHSSQYSPVYSVIDHAVTVVGWDDTYSKDNFKQKPLEDGAWLVRNSAGEYYGMDGYFWLSYEDKTMVTVIGLKTVASDTYDNNYQYYGIGNSKETIYGKQNQKLEAANVFEIKKEKELLKAVQIPIAYADMEYSIQIYKNPTEEDDPLSGDALLDTPLTGSKDWEGLYTVNLEQPVWLEQGDVIAVCVTLTPQHTYMSPGIEYESTKVSLPNRSLYRMGEEDWIDCADVGMGNFVIRAFTSDVKDGIAEEHVHNWSKELTYDSNGHWHECDGEGTCDAAFSCEERGYEKHYGGTATCNSRAVCEGCHQEYGIFSSQHKGDSVCEVCGESISYLDRLKTANPHYELTTITGETVSTASNEKPKLMILYGATCGPCVNTLTNLVSEKLTGVEICALDVNQSGKETIEGLKASLGNTPEVENIQFCYNPDVATEIRGVYTNAFKSIYPDVPISSLPLIAYIDKNDNLCYLSSGLQSFQQIQHNLTAYCGYEVIGLNVPNPSNAVFETVYGTEATLQAEGRPKVVVLYSAEGCKYSEKTLFNFSYNLPDGVDFVAIESWGRDKDKVLSFIEENASYDDRIQFSYEGFWLDTELSYLESAGIDTSQYMSPIVCYIDADNNLQYVSTGICTNGEMRLILERYCDFREPVVPTPTPEPTPEPTPAPEPPAEKNNPFVDVKKDMFFYDPVLWAVEQKITAGVTPTTFAPFAGCTRGEIVTFLYRAMNGEVSDSAECPFTDVSEDAFYYEAVLWAVENGITAGVTPTVFAPNSICTRAEIVSFLYRVAKENVEKDAENPFTDVKETDYYYEAVLWAVDESITAGLTPETFAPNKECTRGECVSFLYRLLGTAR